VLILLDDLVAVVILESGHRIAHQSLGVQVAELLVLG
jgi:hypothetical protein